MEQRGIDVYDVNVALDTTEVLSTIATVTSNSSHV